MNQNSNLHYKMYKSGKYWVFAALFAFMGAAAASQSTILHDAGLAPAAKVSAENPVRETSSASVALNVHDSQVIVGPNKTFQAGDNFDSAYDADGQRVSWPDERIQVTGSVDETKVGDYPVTYTFEGISKTVTVHVIPTKATLVVHDSDIAYGAAWQSGDNVSEIDDENGQALDRSAAKTNEKVDTQKPGVYTIHYSYTDASGNTLAVQTAHVTVNEPTTKTITRTIHFENSDGVQIADDRQYNVSFVRTAEYNGTPGQVTYGTWRKSSESGNWPAVDVNSAVDASKYNDPKITINGQAATTIDAETPTADSKDENIVVTYAHKQSSVTPDTPNLPDNVKRKLVKDVTRTIHYTDGTSGKVFQTDKQTVHFTRSATIDAVTNSLVYNNDWQATGNPTSFAAVDANTAVDVNKYDDPKITINGQAATAIDAETPTADSKDEDIVVTYGHKQSSVTPDKPNLPDKIKQNLAKDVTRSVQFVDAKGSEIIPAQKTTVHFERTATVDNVTGDVSYNNDWHAVGTTTWPAVDPHTAVDASKYDDPKITINGKEATAITAESPNVDTENENIMVTYAHKQSSVTPNTPNIPDDVKQNLVKDVTRTIHYTDGSSGKVLKTDKQTVHFTRSATIDAVTDNVIYNDDWQATGNPTSFAAVDANTAVDLDKYDDPKITINGKEAAAITAETPDADSKDEDIVVTYAHKQSSVTPGTPNLPDKIKQNLAKDVTRSVKFVDAKGSEIAATQTTQVHFERTATIDNVTGEVTYNDDWHTAGTPNAWPAVDVNAAVDLGKYDDPKITINGKEATAITAETPAADTNDENVVVTYANKESSLTPTTPNVPDNIKQNLAKDVTRSVQFVDTKGNEIIPAQKTTVHFERNATVDNVTGEVTYNDDWHTVGTPNTWPAVDVNAAVDLGKYNDPKITINGQATAAITAENPNVDTENENIVVTYQNKVAKTHRVTPDNPGNVSVNTLKKAVTRTIKYEDDHGKTVADPVTETVTFTRDAIVDDASGRVLSYTDWQALASTVWRAQISPDLSNKGLNGPSQQLVASQEVTADTQSTTLVVTYTAKGASSTPTPNHGGNGMPNNGGSGNNGGNATPNNGGSSNNGGNVSPNNGGSGNNGGNVTPNNGGSNNNGGSVTPNNGGSNSNGGNVSPNNGGNSTPNNGGSNNNGGNGTPNNGGSNNNGGNGTPNNGGSGNNGGNVSPNNGGSNNNGGNSTPNNGGSNNNGGNVSPNNGGSGNNGGNVSPNNGGSNNNGGNVKPNNGGSGNNGGNVTPNNGGSGNSKTNHDSNAGHASDGLPTNPTPVPNGPENTARIPANSSAMTNSASKATLSNSELPETGKSAQKNTLVTTLGLFLSSVTALAALKKSKK
ncbi:bacterial Ig-like domain-containing protein [Leuconostocaceae bacterium ESL0958]|nr:bacterial Ig-like domain-containing protein [Leuconostocaceae bacterium ESL0958]